MGQVYSVTLKIKMRDGIKKTALAATMRQWIREEANAKDRMPTNFCLAESRKVGVRPDTLNGICKILLGFHQGGGMVLGEGDFTVYASAFKATYSWFSVLETAFKKMAWYLAEGSSICIESDEGYAIFKIEADKHGESQVWENHHDR